MIRFTFAVLVTCVAAGLAYVAEHTADSLETVKKSLAAGKAMLVDVREAGEWKDGHLKDAKHIALSDLKKGIPADELKRTLPGGSVVYLHCASGKRCLAAADILKKQGYDVRPLKDGYQELTKKGFAPEK